MTRQNTLVSRFVQDSGYNYRKDLTEVFDHENGDIKVEVPRHLRNGSHLIDDPALVMETLLLEPKVDDDAARPPAVADTSGKTFSLVHLFGTDDFADDDARYTSGKWYEKTIRSRQSFPTSKATTSFSQFSPTPPAISTSPSSVTQQFEKPVNSNSLVMKILKSASRTVQPSDGSSCTSQNDALATGGSMSTTALPLLLSFINNSQLSAANVNEPLVPSANFQHSTLHKTVPSTEKGDFTAHLSGLDKTQISVHKLSSSSSDVDERQRQILASLAAAASSQRVIDSAGPTGYVYGDARKMLPGTFLLCQNTSSSV